MRTSSKGTSSKVTHKPIRASEMKPTTKPARSEAGFARGGRKFGPAAPGNARTHSKAIPAQLALANAEIKTKASPSIEQSTTPDGKPFTIIRAGVDPFEAVAKRRTDGPLGLFDLESTAAINRTAAADEPVELAVSEKPVSLYIKTLDLKKDFDLLGENEIYVVAVAWDLSGKPPVVYPPPSIDGLSPVKPTFPMKAGEEPFPFMGDGIQLWPSSKVVGGLSTLIIVMESDGDVQALGERIDQVRKVVTESKSTTALAALASVATAGTVAAAGAFGNALATTVAEVLKHEGDDKVGTWAGTYGAELVDTSREETYPQLNADLKVNFHVAG